MEWFRKHKDLAIVLVVMFGLYGAAYATDAHTRAVQEQQGILIQKRLCQSLDTLARLHPPTEANATKGTPLPPSFSYEENLQRTLAQLGPDVGCK